MAEDRFWRFCGPAAVAGALDIERYEAVALIRKYEPQATASCDIFSIAKAVGREVELAEGLEWSNEACTRYRVPYRWRGVPTLARFLREHPVGSFIVRINTGVGHFINVYDGEVVQDNGFHARRSHVTHYINLEGK